MTTAQGPSWEQQSSATGTLLTLAGVLTAIMVVGLLALAGLSPFAIIIVLVWIALAVIVAIGVGSLLRGLAGRGPTSH